MNFDNLILNDLMTGFIGLTRLFWVWSFDFDSIHHIAQLNSLKNLKSIQLKKWVKYVGSQTWKSWFM